MLHPGKNLLDLVSLETVLGREIALTVLTGLLAIMKYMLTNNALTDIIFGCERGQRKAKGHCYWVCWYL